MTLKEFIMPHIERLQSALQSSPFVAKILGVPNNFVTLVKEHQDHMALTEQYGNPKHAADVKQGFLNYEYLEEERRKEIERLKKENTDLHNTSTTDDLTGLPNERFFDKYLQNRLELSRRDGTSFAVIALDGNGIKKINDAHGHAVGDAAINHIAKTLQHALRGSDLLVRTHGDEFFVVLTSPITRDAAIKTAEKMNKALSESSFTYGGETISIGASFGVVVFNAPHFNKEKHIYESDRPVLDGEQLKLEADATLYKAKENGRKDVCCYDNDQMYISRNGQLELLPDRPEDMINLVKQRHLQKDL